MKKTTFQFHEIKAKKGDCQGCDKGGYQKNTCDESKRSTERILVIDSVERDLVWNFQQGNNVICAFLSLIECIDWNFKHWNIRICTFLPKTAAMSNSRVSLLISRLLFFPKAWVHILYRYTIV